MCVYLAFSFGILNMGLKQNFCWIVRAGFFRPNTLFSPSIYSMIGLKEIYSAHTNQGVSK